MMQLEVGGRRYAIGVGEMIVGSGPDATVVIDGAGVMPRHLVVIGFADGSAAARPAAPQGEVQVNGVRLGAEPTPLLHGDKLTAAAVELLVVDPARGGNTSTMDAAALAAVPSVARPGPGREVGTTGGRIVSLTDGREYRVGDGIVLGRDAAADIVVNGTDVSRQHAEIRPTPAGYVVVDASSNGTWVNGTRVAEPHLLARADVIRVGSEDFRFYADTPVPPPAAAKAPAPAEPADSNRPPPGAAERLNDTLIGLPAAAEIRAAGRAAASRGGPLASLLVRSGRLRGERLPVRTPTVNIGRAEYNDIVLTDESVSGVHARLQRRDGVWMLTDLDSSNGTAVDGEPIREETPLGPGATLKFGEVAVLFEPFDDRDRGRDRDRERALGRRTPEDGAIEPRPAPRRPRPSPVPATEQPAGSRSMLLLLGVLLVAAGVIAFLMLR